MQRKQGWMLIDDSRISHTYDLIGFRKGTVQDMLYRSESRYRQLRVWLVWQNEIQQMGILQ